MPGSRYAYAGAELLISMKRSRQQGNCFEKILNTYDLIGEFLLLIDCCGFGLITLYVRTINAD